jgi:hypothetical protein
LIENRADLATAKSITGPKYPDQLDENGITDVEPFVLGFSPREEVLYGLGLIRIVIPEETQEDIGIDTPHFRPF